MAIFYSDALQFTSVHNGETGSQGDLIVFAYQNAAGAPTKPANGTAAASPWASSASTPPTGQYTWMTSTNLSALGVYGTWSNPMRLSGVEGEDGAGIEYIYFLSANGTPSSAPVAVGNPAGWTADPTGVSFAKPYEYVSFRNKHKWRMEHLFTSSSFGQSMGAMVLA